MSEPRVSVVIAVHNGERYLEGAIESVLRQRPQPAEVIVVDDGSSDSTLTIARHFDAPVRCLPRVHCGANAARNAGVATSRGNYVALLDADDVWTSRALSCELAAFAADPGVDVVFGHVRQFISPDVDEEQARRLICPPGLEPGYLLGASLIKRAAFERVGPLREDVRNGEFIDWMARARELGLREVLLDDHVLWRRLHGANHGLQHPDTRQDYARVLKSALDRRRGMDNDAPP
jgi:glycosyltransferase involved in cell wall biosynthesis